MFDKTSSRTTLSKEEIKTVQNTLENRIAEYNASITSDSTINFVDNYIDLKQYKRQFIAVINLNGEKEVFVNCICKKALLHLEKAKINWRKHSFKVNDGGNCHFHLFINLSSHETRNFRVNGN